MGGDHATLPRAAPALSTALVECLTRNMQLRSGMRVLDLGCGKALTSIFLAQEFNVEVWAVDLWVEPSENLKRIEEAGLGKKVFPIKAEAHQLPFARSFFDAIVSVDSFHHPTFRTSWT